MSPPAQSRRRPRWPGRLTSITERPVAPTQRPSMSIPQRAVIGFIPARPCAPAPCSALCPAEPVGGAWSPASGLWCSRGGKRRDVNGPRRRDTWEVRVVMKGSVDKGWFRAIKLSTTAT